MSYEARRNLAAPTSIAITPSEPTLTINGLFLHFDETTAFEDLSLSVAQGEFLALLGPSGCGKTSLLRSIAGLAHPQRGSICIKGNNVINVPARRRNIGLVFQNYALFPHMTAFQNIAFGLRCRRIEKGEIVRRVTEVLQLVGLSHLANRRPMELSGGQQQRVALARALVIQPDLLLLDEALGALDRKLRVEMQTELKRLQRISGITTIFVTHDQEEALAMADRIAVMRDGKIVQLDAPTELFRSPANAWVAEFMGTGTVVRGRIRKDERGRLAIDIGDKCAIEIDHPTQRVSGTGTEQVLYLRADKIKLHSRSGSDTNFRVTSRRYLGAQYELHASSDSQVLRVIVGEDEAQQIAVGDSVGVSIGGEYCIAIDADNSSQVVPNQPCAAMVK